MPKITNEVLASELQNLTTAINKLEKRFDTFTPTNVMELRFKEIDTKLAELTAKDKELELSISRLKQRSALQVWITGTLSAVVGAILTFLVVFFLNNVGR